MFIYNNKFSWSLFL